MAKTVPCPEPHSRTERFPPRTPCRLQAVDSYIYLVDVLQRIGQYPASRTHERTPLLWQQRFAEQPLRADIERLNHLPA